MISPNLHKHTLKAIYSILGVIFTVKIGYKATFRGILRPPSEALGSCRPLKSSNGFHNKFSLTQIPFKRQFQGIIKDIWRDILFKRGYEATSRGLQRPLSLALGSCTPLESSNECHNKFFHMPITSADTVSTEAMRRPLSEALGSCRPLELSN